MPALSWSWPSDGDTFCTSDLARAAPAASRSGARARGPSPRPSVKLPEITAVPSNDVNDWLSGWISGADCTTPSRAIATCLLEVLLTRAASHLRAAGVGEVDLHRPALPGRTGPWPTLTAFPVRLGRPEVVARDASGHRAVGQHDARLALVFLARRRGDLRERGDGVRVARRDRSFRGRVGRRLRGVAGRRPRRTRCWSSGAWSRRGRRGGGRAAWWWSCRGRGGGRGGRRAGRAGGGRRGRRLLGGTPAMSTGRKRSSAVWPTRRSALQRSFTPGRSTTMSLPGGDLGLRDAEAVDPVADDVDRDVERVGLVVPRPATAPPRPRRAGRGRAPGCCRR